CDYMSYLFFFTYDRPHRDLHSFPTRRSSDLQGETHRLKTSGLIPQGEGYFSKDYVKSIRNSNDYKENEIASNDFIVRNLINCVEDRKSTRLNSSHVKISYAVFCLKKKKMITI